MSDIQSLHVWITGAGSGIGAALALLLAQQGHRVVISGRNRDKLEAVCGQAEGRIEAMVYDVTDDSRCAEMSDHLAERMEHLDVVVLNAGTCEYVDDARLEVDLFRRVFDANLFGAVNSLAIALPLLRKAASNSDARRPQIVGVSSLSTVVGFPRAEAYGASKAALRYMLESLRIDLAHEKIAVSVVSAGFIATPMVEQNDFAMPFMLDADEAARRIYRVIERQPLHQAFPKRLAMALGLCRALSGLWYRYVAPSLARKSASSTGAMS